MARSLKSRLLIAAFGLILLALAGRVIWMGAGMLNEARQLRAEMYSTPPMMTGIHPEAETLMRARWQDKRAERLESASQRQRAGIVLLAMGIALAAGWSVAAWLLWRTPAIAEAPAAPETPGSAINAHRDGGSPRTDS